MVTTALDNVIRFPEGVRGPLTDSDRPRILHQSRDLAAQRLREGVRALIVELREGLAARGDAADTGERRSFCYGGSEFLRQNAVRIEGLFAAHWLCLFDAATVPGGRKPAHAPASALDELELVDFVAMDEDIAVKAVANRLHDGCEEGLYAAGRRLAHLLGRENETLVVAKILAEALQATLKEAEMAGPLRLEIMRDIEQKAVKSFSPVIHDLNTFLVGRNVLPKLRRKYSRPVTERAGATAKEPTGDVFGLLQRLVSASTGSNLDPSATFVPAATCIPGDTGVAMSMAGMAAVMERAMASLDALQHVMPPASAAGVAVPSTSVLRDFRNSSVGQSLGHLDAVTVDIVATLFDFIFDDKEIADPIKALVARLQIPILKVAMLDKTFFSSKSHPARRLLDGISKIAAPCGPGVGHDDPLYVRIADIVERLQAGFTQDASLFETLCAELSDFLDSQEHQADVWAERAAPLVAERERREIAAMAADEVLSTWLSRPLPSAVADLLAHEWRALMVRLYLEQDDVAWDKAVATAADLVASIVPQADAQGRKALAAKLPVMVKSIHDGLDRLRVAVERRMSLLDCLFSIHAAVLRGAAPVVTTLWPQAETPPAIVSESIESGETQLECISLVDADNVPAEIGEGEAQDRVDQLQRGDWVEFSGESRPVRYRLSWVSPERGILLFTNPQSPRALSVAPAALAMQIERGEAAIVPVEPIFERAVNRALETLKAA
jgi:hypothetical protein